MSVKPKKKLAYNKSKVKYWLKDLSRQYKVYVPQMEMNNVVYRELDDIESIVYDFPVPPRSIKEFFLPPSETLWKYRREGRKWIAEEVKKTVVPTIIFGVKPYDGKAMTVLDRELGDDPVYRARRENTILIGIAVNDPAPTEFGSSVGTSPFNREGLDLLFIDTGRDYLVEVLTEKGESILAPDFLDANEKLLNAAERLERAAEEKATYELKLDRWNEHEEMEIFNLPYWDEVFFTCLSCGVCSFYCPVSITTDIRLVVGRDEGEGVRVWDSQMFASFNADVSRKLPPKTRREKIRDWVLEMFLFYPKRHNAGYKCVGCGRCVQFCPAKIDIRKIVANVRFE